MVLWRNKIKSAVVNIMCHREILHLVLLWWSLLHKWIKIINKYKSFLFCNSFLLRRLQYQSIAATFFQLFQLLYTSKVIGQWNIILPHKIIRHIESDVMSRDDKSRWCCCWFHVTETSRELTGCRPNYRQVFAGSTPTTSTPQSYRLEATKCQGSVEKEARQPWIITHSSKQFTWKWMEWTALSS